MVRESAEIGESQNDVHNKQEQKKESTRREKVDQNTEMNQRNIQIPKKKL